MTGKDDAFGRSELPEDRRQSQEFDWDHFCGEIGKLLGQCNLENRSLSAGAARDGFTVQASRLQQQPRYRSIPVCRRIKGMKQSQIARGIELEDRSGAGTVRATGLS